MGCGDDQGQYVAVAGGVAEAVRRARDAGVDRIILEVDRIDQIEEDVRYRDDERLAEQLSGGMYAGVDKLHGVTPRAAAKSDQMDDSAA